jgi:hypothetical protein
MNEVTVNENALSSSLSCPLLSYFVVSLHTDRVRVYACVRKERETEREPRAANGRRWSEGQANAREKESKKDRTPQGCREREKKKCIIVKRTIIWRFTVGRRSGVGWWWWRRSLLFFLSCITFLSRSRLRCMQHLVCPATQHCLFFLLLPDFFSLFFFSFFLCKKTNDGDTQCNNSLFSFIIIRILQAYDTSI